MAATSTRRAPGATGWCGRWPATRSRPTSSTASPASACCPRSSSTGCPATRTRSPCASATRRWSSSSSTSTARSSTRSTRRASAACSGRRGWLAGRRGAAAPPGEGLEHARRGHLGGARRAPALRAFEGHGLGRLRPGDPLLRGGGDPRAGRDPHHRHQPSAEPARDVPVARWREIRDQIHAEVCAKGFDPELNSFVQSYGSKRLDASLLLIAHMGFLPQDDPARGRHRRGHRPDPDARRLRAALRHRGPDHRRPARRRGRLPALLASGTPTTSSASAAARRRVR